jgi:hypothetical protein
MRSLSHEDRQEVLLKYGLVIYFGSKDVTVSTIRRGENTIHALAKLRLSGTELATRLTAFLAFHKVNGTLRVFPDANSFYRNAHTIQA